MEIRKIVALILLVVSGITGIVSGILIAYNKFMYEINMLRAEFENYKKGMGVLIDTSINERLEWCHDNIEEHYKQIDGIKNSLKLNKERITRLEDDELKREIKEHYKEHYAPPIISGGCDIVGMQRITRSEDD